MQCASILYPQTHKIWCFKPSLSITPLPQQQQLNPYDQKPKLITSPSNPFVKHCLKLRNCSSYRRSHASALVVGATPIREICRFRESLQDGSVLMDCLILPNKAEIPDGLDKSTVPIVRVSSVVMRKLSGLQTTDSLDAIAVVKIPASFFSVDGDQKNCQKWFPSTHRILVLDGIQDPGNLGTLLRSAVAFRWVRNYLPPLAMGSKNIFFLSLYCSSVPSSAKLCLCPQLRAVVWGVSVAAVYHCLPLPFCLSASFIPIPTFRTLVGSIVADRSEL
ncbi:hypothetical protein CR513_48420, partial [Mucuna pruriens]